MAHRGPVDRRQRSPRKSRLPRAPEHQHSADRREGTSLAYEPIEDHGLIGNMKTAALVGMHGSIDWMCFPRFDSPSIFAAILDHRKGGWFRIAPSGQVLARKQFYWPDTNVLVTRFFTPDGEGEVLDFMPVGISAGEGRLVRRVRTLRGRVAFRVECRPAFNYARDSHEIWVSGERASFRSRSQDLALWAEVPLVAEEGAAITELLLDEGQSSAFVLSGGAEKPPTELAVEAEGFFRDTVEYWHRWLSKCTYSGRWREQVYRSALVLKLLTYDETGAIVAAPTTSLPEHVGGVRNWDYRYTWIRDAAFTLYALIRIGFTEEAARFMDWIDRRVHEESWDGLIPALCGIDGRHEVPETTLDHLEGYEGSRPVRVGNAAYRQLQLDVYGELLDAVYLYNKYGTPISFDLWTHLERILERVSKSWRLQDEGIWEVRGPRKHFVFSKLMCWVALDRGLRLAEKRSFPGRRALWARSRDLIYREIMSRGWNDKVGAFVQSYESESLDAANLLMPLVFFVSPTDPRMLSTLDAINRPPARGGLGANGLVFRYDHSRTQDGLAGPEGTFNMCTFWLVEALTRAGREDRARLDQARLLFEQMLGYANHLGLYAEQTGPAGEALGNFPQALTHLSLISAAFNLDRALGSRWREP